MSTNNYCKLATVKTEKDEKPRPETLPFPRYRAFQLSSKLSANTRERLFQIGKMKQNYAEPCSRELLHPVR